MDIQTYSICSRLRVAGRRSVQKEYKVTQCGLYCSVRMVPFGTRIFAGLSTDVHFKSFTAPLSQYLINALLLLCKFIILQSISH